MKLNLKSLVLRVFRKIKLYISIIRGYQHYKVADFDLRLVPESSNFENTCNLDLSLSGSRFVRWTDLVQLQIFVRRLEGLDEPFVVDVGAHHGLYALLAGAFCKRTKGGKVLAFEPELDNYETLKKNIALNHLDEWVIPINKAVGERCETVKISCSGSQSQINSQLSEDYVSVEQVDLRSAISADLKHIDILIIDVEGAELPVLKGFPWDHLSIASIFCEFHPYAWKDFGYSASDMTKFLREHQFQALDMFQEDQTDCRTEHYVGPTLFKNIK